MDMKHVAGRRGFIKQTAAMSAGLAGFGMLPQIAAAVPDTGVNIIGPKPGYSPQVGTMVSMLTWMQGAVVGPVKGMTKQDLDYLFDARANSIGSLAATSGRFRNLLSDEHLPRDKMGQLAGRCEAEMGSCHEPRRCRPQNHQRQ